MRRSFGATARHCTASLRDAGAALRVFGRTGLLAPGRPDRLMRTGRALHQWGFTLAGGFAANAQRCPDAVAVVDERGAITFGELHRRSNALAHGFLDAGIRDGTTVAMLCRNHRGFVGTTAALAKVGATALQCNTGFAAPQLGEVLNRERATAIVFDEEFTGVVREAAPGLRTFVAWHEGAATDATIEALAAGRSVAEPPPARSGRTIILTSGTTGTPRGVPRAQTSGAGPLVALCSVLPLRTGECTVIAAPLFHSWGFAHLALGVLLGSTVALRRRFDPVATLEAIEQHRATVLVAVPVMLQRMLDVPEATRRAFDVSSLRAVVVSGATLPGRLALRFMDAFGDVLYNLYGSTEVAYATIATPADLRANPATAGSPMRDATVVLIDEDGRPVPRGRPGLIFVGNEMLFDGYTGGGSKAMAGDLMSTGDVGYFDTEGRLTVVGREDEMIVSGGENVFPEEVEHLLAQHDAIAEAAVVGVSDRQFGQRLKAFVVLAPGASLTATDVRAYVRANLARHKVPRDVEFTHVLPRNTTGKVVRRALQASRADTVDHDSRP